MSLWRTIAGWFLFPERTGGANAPTPRTWYRSETLCPMGEPYLPKNEACVMCGPGCPRFPK
jgi:hypothetical protein